jgi:hypothetical protein
MTRFTSASPQNASRLSARWMPVVGKALGTICAVVLVGSLAGCAGYHLGPTGGGTAGGKSIAILPFNNQTMQPRLGDAVTQALRERIQTDGTYRLGTDEGSDLILTGVIKSYERVGLNYLSVDVITPENYQVKVVVHVTERERTTGKLLIDKDVAGYSLVHVGADLASADRQSQPLLAEDLARNIIELVTEGAW